MIFRTKRAEQFRQESHWRAWDPIRRAFAAGLPATHHLRERVTVDPDNQLDFYELRHFGASYMLNELELEPWVIAEQLRHGAADASSLSSTATPTTTTRSSASDAPTPAPT